MKTLPLALGLLALAGTASAQVADPKFAFAKADEVKEVVWKASAQAGAIFTTGNSNTITVSGGFSASRNDGKNKLVLDLAGAYARSTVYTAWTKSPGDKTIYEDGQIVGDKKMTAGFFLGKLRYDRFFTPNNSLYLTGFGGLDRPAGKEATAGGQAGYARQIVKTKMHEFAGELGYDFSFVSYITPVDTHTFLHSGRVFLGYLLTIADSTTIAASVEALINFNKAVIAERDIGVAEATRVNGKIALTTKLWKNLNLRVSFTARYDNAPAARAPIPGFAYGPDYKPLNEKLDTITDASLVVNFL